MKIGVVVGRFQTPMLTVAHKQLLKEANDENDRVVVFIQQKYVNLTDDSPLPYDIREYLVANFCHEHLDKAVDILPLIEQKYMSVLLATIDENLMELHGYKSDYTLYTKKGSNYTGLCKVKEFDINQMHSSASLREAACETSRKCFRTLNGIVATSIYQKPVVHNFVVGLIKQENGILVERRHKKFNLPTVELTVSDDTMEEALENYIFASNPLARITNSDYVKGFKIADWRFRNCNDTAYYHLFTSRWLSGDLKDLMLYKPPFNPEFFEDEYKPIIAYLTR